MQCHLRMGRYAGVDFTMTDPCKKSFPYGWAVCPQLAHHQNHILKFGVPFSIPPPSSYAPPRPKNMPPGPQNMPPEPQNMPPGSQNMPPGPQNISPGPQNRPPKPQNMPPKPQNMSLGPETCPLGPKTSKACHTCLDLPQRPGTILSLFGACACG